jgi:flagellar assembly protein FliH
MSTRARLLLAAPNVERFDWGVVAEGDTSDDVPVPGLENPAPAAPAPAVIEVTAAEQQARLAALEREAFAKGYAQGERAGIEAGAKRVDAMLRRVAQTLEDLAQLRRTIVRETERQMVELSLTLAQRVITREVSLDPTLVAAIAHVALERLGESSPATIRLNPEDYAIVSAHKGEHWSGAQVTILPDPAVARGGCIVESEFGTVDGSVAAQLAELTRVLLGDSTEGTRTAVSHAE